VAEAAEGEAVAAMTKCIASSGRVGL
jgi:hypothetical protein